MLPYGAALAQQQQSDELMRPIAYASQCLQPHEKIMGLLNLRVLGFMGCKTFPTLHIWAPL